MVRWTEEDDSPYLGRIEGRKRLPCQGPGVHIPCVGNDQGTCTLLGGVDRTGRQQCFDLRTQTIGVLQVERTSDRRRSCSRRCGHRHREQRRKEQDFHDVSDNPNRRRMQFFFFPMTAGCLSSWAGVRISFPKTSPHEHEARQPSRRASVPFPDRTRGGRGEPGHRRPRAPCRTTSARV